MHNSIGRDEVESLTSRYIDFSLKFRELHEKSDPAAWRVVLRTAAGFPCNASDAADAGLNTDDAELREKEMLSREMRVKEWQSLYKYDIAQIKESGLDMDFLRAKLRYDDIVRNTPDEAERREKLEHNARDENISAIYAKAYELEQKISQGVEDALKQEKLPRFVERARQRPGRSVAISDKDLAVQTVLRDAVRHVGGTTLQRRPMEQELKPFINEFRDGMIEAVERQLGAQAKRFVFRHEGSRDAGAGRT